MANPAETSVKRKRDPLPALVASSKKGSGQRLSKKPQVQEDNDPSEEENSEDEHS